jgi:hypothetical protein
VNRLPVLTAWMPTQQASHSSGSHLRQLSDGCCMEEGRLGCVQDRHFQVTDAHKAGRRTECNERCSACGMTVAELIEELGKFPPHHVGCVTHPDGECGGEDGLSILPAVSESYIVEVRAAGACEVVIDVTPNF